MSKHCGSNTPIPKNQFHQKKFKRKNDFRIDPVVKTVSATPADYRNSGYDRGHLCPAGDMAFSEIAMSESFYMSNISPQVPSFNRGIWKTLEQKVRDWSLDMILQLYIVGDYWIQLLKQ